MTMNLDDVRALADAIRAEIAKAIVGQEAMVDMLLVAMLSEGHVLLEGRRRKAQDPKVKWAVVTMCIAGGMGAAGLFEIY